MSNNRNRKKKNSSDSTTRLIQGAIAILIVLVLAIGLLAIEIYFVRQRNEGTTVAEENVVVANDVAYVATVEEELGLDEGMSFETFADKVYTESELESLSASDIRVLRYEQGKIRNNVSLSIKRIGGSAYSATKAVSVAENSFKNRDEFVDSSKLVLETDIYYVVDVTVDYISTSGTSRYVIPVLVFKKECFDADKNVVNVDDIEKVKNVLDLFYYIENFDKTDMRLIQSFIHDRGEYFEYDLYYTEIEIGENSNSDTLYIVREAVMINAETGEIESANVERVSSGVRDN